MNIRSPLRLAHLGPCAEAIAVMRLAIMAQGDPPLLVVEAFSELSSPDQACLMTELSRTGCSEQVFTRNGARPPAARAEM